MRPVLDELHACAGIARAASLALWIVPGLLGALAGPTAARPPLSVRSQPDSATTRMAASGAGPRTARLSAYVRDTGASLREANVADSPAATTLAAGGETWIDVPCDVFQPGKANPRQWMSTATLARVTQDGYNYQYGYDPLAQSYDALVSGYASTGGVLVQETVGVIAARIPAAITAQNIRRVELWFVVSATNLYPYEWVGFTDLSTTAAPSSDLGSSAMQALYDDARGFSGQVYYLDHIPAGAHALDLGETAVSHLAQRVGTPGWFGVGLAADGWDLSGSLGELVQWRVVGGGSASLDSRPFLRMYYNAPPDAFALLDPPDAADVSAAAPRLAWAPASDPNGDAPLSYIVRLGTDPDLDPSFTLDAGTATAVTVPFPLAPGNYTWEVVARDPGGATRASARWGFHLVQTTDAIGPRLDRVPTLAAVPNPFNPRTELRFHLPRTGAVRLWVADVRGRSVTRLLDEELTAGDHSVRWNGVDGGGSSCASGVYYAVLETPLGVARTRLSLVR